MGCVCICSTVPRHGTGRYGTGTVMLLLFLGFTGRYQYPVPVLMYVVYRYGTVPYSIFMLFLVLRASESFVSECVSTVDIVMVPEPFH